MFYVVEGTMSVRVGDRWVHAPKGSFVMAPAGVTHDLENRTAEPAMVLNVSCPGNFEPRMADIVAWFTDHPPGPPADAAT